MIKYTRMRQGEGHIKSVAHIFARRLERSNASSHRENHICQNEANILSLFDANDESKRISGSIGPRLPKKCNDGRVSKE